MASKNDFPKITVEGLRVAGSFLNTLRCEETGAIDPKYKDQNISEEFYDVMREKLDNVANPGMIK